MKKILIIALAISLAMVGVAFADGVVGSLHDLRDGTNLLGTGSAQVCVMCHHPHRGTGNGALTGNELLWNITAASMGTFQTYTSGSMNATDAGGPLTTSGDSLYSLLCMACHDGSLAANALVRKPTDGTSNTIALTITGGANLGDTLEDDHPVDFVYDAELAGTWDKELKSPENGMVDSIYPLFSETMQCATCHDVHRGGLTTNPGCGTAGQSCDPKIEFMLGDTRSSEICLDCHIK